MSNFSGSRATALLLFSVVLPQAAQADFTGPCPQNAPVQIQIRVSPQSGRLAFRDCSTDPQSCVSVGPDTSFRRIELERQIDRDEAVVGGDNKVQTAVEGAALLFIVGLEILDASRHPLSAGSGNSSLLTKSGGDEQAKIAARDRLAGLGRDFLRAGGGCYSQARVESLTRALAAVRARDPDPSAATGATVETEALTPRPASAGSPESGSPRRHRGTSGGRRVH